MLLDPPTLPTAAPVVPAPPRPLRTWPAILTLFLLAPISGETLSGSTPPLVYLIDPVRLLFNPLLYGGGALLIREVARRRGLGWGSILIMGAAYGVFEEGLVVNTWANPWSAATGASANCQPTGLCDYGRFGGINLLWALELTAFHAVVSIFLPILLTELAFPARAARPWLGRKAIGWFAAGLALELALGLLLNVAVFRQHGQGGPLLVPYLFEAVLILALIDLALRVPPDRKVDARRRPPPRGWLRVVGCVALGLTILAPTLIFHRSGMPPGLAVGLFAAALALLVWRVAAWGRRADWTLRETLALASGAAGFFVLIWDPFIEVLGDAGGLPTRGTALVALAFLIFMIVLARRTKRRVLAASLAGGPGG